MKVREVSTTAYVEFLSNLSDADFLRKMYSLHGSPKASFSELEGGSRRFFIAWVDNIRVAGIQSCHLEDVIYLFVRVAFMTHELFSFPELVCHIKPYFTSDSAKASQATLKVVVMDLDGYPLVKTFGQFHSEEL